MSLLLLLFELLRKRVKWSTKC